MSNLTATIIFDNGGSTTPGKPQILQQCRGCYDTTGVTCVYAQDCNHDEENPSWCMIHHEY